MMKRIIAAAGILWLLSGAGIAAADEGHTHTGHESAKLPVQTGHSHGGGEYEETPANYKVLGTFGIVNGAFLVIGLWNKRLLKSKEAASQ